MAIPSLSLPDGLAHSSLSLSFSAGSPPAAPASSRSRPARNPRLSRKSRPRRPVHRFSPPPPQPLMKYSLAHHKGATRFAAAPIIFTRPARGVARAAVTCPTCQQKVTVLVRSPAAVRLERWKRIAYILLVALALFAFTSLIPWERFFSGAETCVSLLAFLAFGTIGLYNGAQVIASDAALLLDLPRKPFLDMFPSINSNGSHAILKKNL